MPEIQFAVHSTLMSFHICYAYIIEANATGGQTDGVCYSERSIQYSYFKDASVIRFPSILSALNFP